MSAYFGTQVEATLTPRRGNRWPLYVAHCSLRKSTGSLPAIRGQGSTLQLLNCNLDPMQYLPPCSGVGLLHWRLDFWIPPPQNREQVPYWLHELHPPSTGINLWLCGTHSPRKQCLPGEQGEPSALGKFLVWHWLERLKCWCNKPLISIMVSQRYCSKSVLLNKRELLKRAFKASFSLLTKMLE